MAGGALHVNHQGLDAMHQISGKQATHLASAQGYIRDNCSRAEAFHGVLAPFKGTYDEVIRNADKGMSDAQQFSGKMSNALHQANQTYRETDTGERDRWTTTMQRAEGVSSKDIGRFGYKGVSKPLDDILGIDPKTKDPLTALQDRAKEKLGADPSDVRQRKIDANARRRNKQQVGDRAEETQNDRSTGLTRRERRAAAAAGRRTDNEDVRTRRGVLDNTVKPIKETVDVVTDGYDKVKNIVADVNQFHHTSQDLDDYEDYETRGHDATTQLKKELGG